jgi:hypothetical protein
MTKTIYGKYHSVHCKFIITEEQIKEAQEAMKYLKGCKWQGNLQINVKPSVIYHTNKELFSEIECYIHVDKEFMSLAYDGYESTEFITEMQDITKLPDIWASDSFMGGLTNRYEHGRIDKRFLSNEDRENLRHLVIMYKLEESQ